MIIVTVSTASRLAQAILLGKTAKEQMPSVRIVVGVVEEFLPYEAALSPYIDEFVLIRNINVFPSFEKFMFQYTPTEACGASKSLVMKYAYEKYIDEEYFVYMDSDIRVMGPFDELISELDRHPIVLTSHHNVSPEPFSFELLRVYRFFGIFNSGFIAAKRHPSAQQFIDWWIRRMERESIIEPPTLFTDQTWFDLVPALFDGVTSLMHWGYNVGPWNFNERRNLVQTGPMQYLVNGAPLRCLHYAGIRYYNAYIRGDLPAEFQAPYVQLRNVILGELEQLGESAFNRYSWSYEKYANGSRIGEEARRVFRQHYYYDSRITNPFLLSDAFFLEKREHAGHGNVDPVTGEVIGKAGGPLSRAARARRRLARKLRRKKRKTSQKLKRSGASRNGSKAIRKTAVNKKSSKLIKKAADTKKGSRRIASPLKKAAGSASNRRIAAK